MGNPSVRNQKDLSFYGRVRLIARVVVFPIGPPYPILISEPGDEENNSDESANISGVH